MTLESQKIEEFIKEDLIVFPYLAPPIMPNMYAYSGSHTPRNYGTQTRVDVRTEPKIGRNDICPKCDSGIKFKKCCGK